MNSDKRHFVVVDDDSVNNYLTTHILKRQLPDSVVTCFTSAEECMQFLRSQTDVQVQKYKTLLFIDINMPQTSGWDALDLLKDFPEKQKEQWQIYLFTSSIATEDKERAKKHPMVCDILTKPLNSQDMNLFLENPV